MEDSKIVLVTYKEDDEYNAAYGRVSNDVLERESIEDIAEYIVKPGVEIISIRTFEYPEDE